MANQIALPSNFVHAALIHCFMHGKSPEQLLTSYPALEHRRKELATEAAREIIKGIHPLFPKGDEAVAAVDKLRKNHGLLHAPTKLALDTIWSVANHPDYKEYGRAEVIAWHAAKYFLHGEVKFMKADWCGPHHLLDGLRSGATSSTKLEWKGERLQNKQTTSEDLIKERGALASILFGPSRFDYDSLPELHELFQLIDAVPPPPKE